MGSVAEILDKRKVRYIRIDGATSRYITWSTIIYGQLTN